MVQKGQVFLETLTILNGSNDPNADPVETGCFYNVYELRVESSLSSQILSFDTLANGASNILKVIPLSPLNCFGSDPAIMTLNRNSDRDAAADIAHDLPGAPKIEFMDLMYANHDLVVGVPIIGLNLNGLTFSFRLADQNSDELVAANVTGFSATILVVETFDE